jgi:alpha-1,6-mannosyltransferase
MPRSSLFTFIFLVLISGAAYLGIAYYLNRVHFLPLLFLYTLAFAAYGALSTGKFFFLKILLPVTIIFRVLFLFSWPALSDDYFRFIWDGRLVVAGFNPFEHLPSYYLTFNEQISGINAELFQQLNSPQYFSVYPSFCQIVFALSAWLAPQNNWGMVLIMRLIVLTAEIGNIVILLKLLRYYQKPAKQVLWYALNPLVIVELTGNLHFEAFMLFFLFAFYYWLS